MPGITGIIRLDRQLDRNALPQMVSCMVHEPFYTSGSYYNEGFGLSLGWTSFEGAFADCLPIWNETGDVALFFSGEHYPDEEEIRRLRANGHHFEPNNASYLVHLYEELGSTFLEQLNGLFSGVLLDLRERKLILFCDRYGLNRIYYHEAPEGFYFSSEAKALLKVLPETRRFDFASLGEFFSCGCTLEHRSLFAAVSILPGGETRVFSPGQPPRKENYFAKRDWESQSTLSAHDYTESLKETFPRVLARYTREQKNLGISLTGGVDSRLVMAWAKRDPGTLPCYTFGGKYRDSIDVRVAREVARICDQPHQVIHVGNDFLREFPNLAEKTVWLSDGAMDVSGSADLFVNRVARQIAPLRLTGNYGGEIMRGLVAFKPIPLHNPIFDRELSRHIGKAFDTYRLELTNPRTSFVALKQTPWHHFSRLSLERSQIVMRSPYLDNDLVKLVYRAPVELSDSNDLSLQLIHDGNSVLGRLATDRGVSLRGSAGLGRIHNLFQQFTFKAEYAYDYGMPQSLARCDHVLAGLHLEKLFLGRHKFHHFRIWYRDELSSYLKEILLDPRTLGRPYFQATHLEQIVRQHTRGDRNYTLELHRILSCELMARQFLEQGGTAKSASEVSLPNRSELALPEPLTT